MHLEDTRILCQGRKMTYQIQSSSDNVISHTRAILRTTASNHNDRMLLYIVAFWESIGSAIVLYEVTKSNPI